MTTLTEDQRARLTSRPVAILRGLIQDMVGAAEEVTIEHALSPNTLTKDAVSQARRCILNAQETIVWYVVDSAGRDMLSVWDDASQTPYYGAELAPWRARLAAALEICKRPGCAYC